MANINKEMAKGAAWMVIFKFAGRGIGVVSTMILARLLLPNDFGLIAMAMSVIALLELMSAFGFDMALIQNQKAEDKHYNTAWTFNVIFGLTSAIILILIAQPVSAFYLEPRLENVIYALSLGAFIQGLENIGVVDFRKQMQFRKEFKFLLTVKILGFFIVIPCAYFLRNYWALVAGIVASRLIQVTLSYAVHPYRPRFSLNASSELFNFSKWLLLTNIFSFLKTRSADFIIGRQLGAKTLGLYSVTLEISEISSTEIVMPINRAIFPGFAKLAHDIKLLKESFLGVLSMVAIFSIPAGTGMAATAEYIIPILLGNKWAEAIPLVGILAFAGVITSLQTNIPYVYFALNKPHMTTIFNVIYVSIFIPLIFILTSIASIKGAAYAYLLTTLVLLPLNLYMLSRYISFTLIECIHTLWRPIIASTIMFYCIRFAIHTIEISHYIPYKIISFLLLVILGILAYFLCLVFLWVISGKPKSAEYIIYHKTKSFIDNHLPTRV